ncbi:MAG: Rieske (2Fe-2S) protein [Actinomycetota bacterium]|nr:Rieske (2Fe-2S) protein [Actinomycetota bacterium]
MKHNVCTLEQLPPGASRVITARDQEVLVVNLDGELFAINNRCAHRQQPLAEGVVRDGIITCPAHLWRYNIRTGQRHDSPGWSVACYPVVVEASMVMVEVPEPEESMSMRDQLLQHAREWNRDS